MFLSVQEYGEFSLFLLYVTTLSLFSLMGLGTSNNIIISNGENSLEYKIFFLKKSIKYWFYIYIVISLIFYIYASFIDIKNIIFYILSLGAVSFSLLLEGALFGFKRYKILVFIGFFCFISSIFLYYMIGKDGIYYSLLSYFLSRFFVLLWYCYAVFNILKSNKKSQEYNFNKRFNEDFKNIAIPFFITTLCSGPIFSINFLYLENFLGIENFSYLNWSYQLYLITTFLPVALTPLIISKFSDSKNFNKIYKLLCFVLSFQILIVFIFLMFLDNFLLFAGDIYLENSRKSSLIFLVCSILFGLNSIFMSFWPAIGKGRIQLLSQVLFVSILTLSNFFLLPILGLISFPIGMLFALIFQSLYQIHIFLKVVYVNK